MQVLHTPESKERYLKAGMDTVGSSPEELAVTMKSDIAKLSKVIKNAGLRAGK